MRVPEPMGIIGIGCPESCALLGFVSVVLPAIARGNRVIVIPSQRFPLAAVDFYQLLDTSDVPAGAVNIVTGQSRTLMETLAAHDGVDAVWYWGGAEICKRIEHLSVGNLKQTWVHIDRGESWLQQPTIGNDAFLRHATQVKNIWIPYGE